MKINLKSIKMHKNTKGMMNSVTCKQNHHNCLPKKYQTLNKYISPNIPIYLIWIGGSAPHINMYICICIYIRVCTKIYIYI